MPKYKVILFDMDGTIAYTDEMIFHTFYDLYDLYNPSARKEKDQLIYFSGPPLSKTLPVEFPNQDFNFMYNEFIRISKPYYDLYVTPFEDEIEVLTKLKEKGYKLAVVTNKGHDMAEYVLKLLKIDHLFEFVIGNGDTKNNKPHPEGIELALSLLNASKEECLYVGDNDIDYETAANANVDSMICAWGPRMLNVLSKCNYVIHSYKEMGDILL